MARKRRTRKQVPKPPKHRATIFDLPPPETDPEPDPDPEPGPAQVPRPAPRPNTRDAPSPSGAVTPTSLPTAIHEGVVITHLPILELSPEAGLPAGDPASEERVVGNKPIASYEEFRNTLGELSNSGDSGLLSDTFAFPVTDKFMYDVVQHACSILRTTDLMAIPLGDNQDAIDVLEELREVVGTISRCRNLSQEGGEVVDTGAVLTKDRGASESEISRLGSHGVLKNCIGALLNLLERCRILGLQDMFPKGGAEEEALESGVIEEAPRGGAGGGAQTAGGGGGRKEGTQGVKGGVEVMGEITAKRLKGKEKAATPEEQTMVENPKTIWKGKAIEIVREDWPAEEEGNLSSHLMESLESLQLSINTARDICRSAIAEGGEFSTSGGHERSSKPSSSTTPRLTRPRAALSADSRERIRAMLAETRRIRGLM